ncbi:GTP-binding protein A [Mycena sanguinolenta]|uniref:GTP-binding protein A n=1 Tax=Mycena sanguinolenta TaxID=230812 RepID=A0A8H6YA60_9AGAR|nr:GTP-binding protein A [Mycena sanguinolenta]
MTYTTNPASAMIAVLGSTGAGKSSFMRLITNDDTEHSRRSDTSQIIYTEVVDNAGRQLTFMDTPDFSDSEGLSDVDILQMISNDLHSEYGKGKLLSGVIYIDNIANTRDGGVNMRTIRMLENLLGPGGCENVVLVTTGWDTARTTDGERREAELRSDERLFKLLIDAGAKMIRHDSGPESARRIIEAILGNQREQRPLLPAKLNINSGGSVEHPTLETFGDSDLISDPNRIDEPLDTGRRCWLKTIFRSVGRWAHK